MRRLLLGGGDAPLYRVAVKRRALKAIPELPPAHRAEIRRLVSVLESDPIPHHSYDVAKLEGIRDAFRVRIGGVRLIYATITITRIEPRGGAYKGL